MKKALAFIFAYWFALAPMAVAQTTYKLNELTELAAEPADTDWLLLWDTSASTSKKISRENFLTGSIIPETFGLTDPGADRLLFWDDSASTYRHLTLGTGLSISDTTINAESGGGSSLTSTQIAYGAGDNTITSEAAFKYTAANNLLSVGSIQINGDTGPTIYSPAADHIGFSADGTGDEIVFDLDTDNSARVYSGTGVGTITFDTINIAVPTEVYDATGWNGDLTVPTKDAVRDKIEALTLGSAGLTATYVGYGDGSNALTGEAAFAYNASTNTLTVENATFTNLNTTNLNAESFLLKETSGAGTQTLEIFAASDYTVNRSLYIYTGDNDTDLTIPSAGTLTMAASNYANAWSDGVKQTFNPNGTNAGINVGSHTADPSSPANGDLWYDSTANELTARINGANVALGAGGGSSGLGYVLQTYPVSNLSWSYSTTYYFGTTPSHTSTYDAAKIEIPKAGTIKRITYRAQTSAAGSNESTTVSCRLNDTTDVGSATIDMSGSPPIRAVNSSVSQAVSAGDFICIKVATPAYATNPTNCQLVATIYIE